MAKRRKGIHGLNITSRIKDSLVSAGTGAGVSVVESAIGAGDMVNYGMLAAGILLPSFAKGEALRAVGDSLVAIGGYNVGRALDLPGKLGLSSPITGLADRNMISAAPDVSRFFRNKRFAEGKAKPSRTVVIPASENVLS